jgi:DNA-binding Lrp family transcriptional regulator
MRGLDDIDREILSLLLEDGRRPYSDIADRVDLSPPAVSDRIERLQDLGVIRRFTLDLDRAMLRDGIQVLVDLQVPPGRAAEVTATLVGVDAVDHVFRTADERVVFNATVPDGDVQSLLAGHLEDGDVVGFDIDLLTDVSWRPSLDDVDLAAVCDECGNTVTAEGETATLDGTGYQFCCVSCKQRFVDKFERFEENADV